MTRSVMQGKKLSSAKFLWVERTLTLWYFVLLSKARPVRIRVFLKTKTSEKYASTKRIWIVFARPHETTKTTEIRLYSEHAQ